MQTIDESRLPDGNVTVAVGCSALLGHEVAAVTRRRRTSVYLIKFLGAARIVAREEIAETVKRPLKSET